MLRATRFFRCAAQAEPLVLSEIKGKVCVLTMNRPKALNALNQAIATELTAAAVEGPVRWGGGKRKGSIITQGSLGKRGA